jgi:hypothetical protein
LAAAQQGPNPAPREPARATVVMCVAADLSCAAKREENSSMDI